MLTPKFIHLKVHSDYSMRNGLAKVSSIVKQAKKLEMPAIGLTDFTNLCGLVKFYNIANSSGIKPIIGADFTLQSEMLDGALTSLTILAADNIGYKNLTLIISKAYKRGFIDDRPVIDNSWLKEFSEGLIILSGGFTGELGYALLKNNQDAIEDICNFYKTNFANNFYIELTRTFHNSEEIYLHKALKISQDKNIPVVATNNVQFIHKDEFEAHEIRVAIHDGYTLVDPRRPKLYTSEQYLKTESEMVELFSDVPQALANSVEIAKRCNVTVRLGEYFLPNFPTDGKPIEEFLVLKSKLGLEERLVQLFPDKEQRSLLRKPYDERLEIELNVVNQMGFPGYFLIVMEFIQWSKDNHVPVGPGRGSGAGSLVAYSLKITDLDPLAFDLLFERFLNPERVSMPDFDVDFCMDKRDLVIDHVAQMYGRDAVSQIITFGTLAAKMVIRDVGRVLGHPYGFVDRITKMIPADPGMTLEKAFSVEPRLVQEYESDEEVKALIDMAKLLEGTIRNAGKHAGGVVISPTSITDFSPIYCDQDGENPVTQFDKNDVEAAGLVKFDFLGLRTLTIIDWALEMINAQRQGQKKLDIISIPLNDKKAFDLLKKQETTAVFQLESRGMKDLIRRLQPDCFEDIIALVALFRPGPLQSGMVDNFIDRKHGNEEVSYPDAKYQHESLKEILEPTYGVILYQEQVMQIAQVLAGYSLGGADLLRRAMGKKKPSEMAKQRAVFEKGAIDNGVDGELAMKIFDLVEKFAGYGFNKSHSAAYALVSYQTLWLKTHYPAEFMAAVMTADMDNTDKIIGLVAECRRMGLDIQPPDVNSGKYRFTVNDKGQIVYGIGAIKGVGEGPVNEIVVARDEKGHFKDLFDFCARMDTKKVNKRVLEKLIYSGAMDKLGPHRAAMMASLPDAVKASSQFHKAQLLGQMDMFGVLTQSNEEVEAAYVNVPKWSDQVWLDGEKETLGLYLTGHPINSYFDEIKRYTDFRLKDVTPTPKNKMVSVAGLVIDARTITTKKGNRMGILTIDDSTAHLDVTLFSDSLEKYQNLIEKDKILIIQGQIVKDHFNGGFRLTGREILEIVDARERFAKGLGLVLYETQVTDDFLQNLSKLLMPFKEGVVPVRIHYKQKYAMVKMELDTQWRVTPSEKLLFDLRQLLGEKQVGLEFE